MPTEAPIVSIVIATYQRLARIRRCIEAIENHVTTPHEIIVVDGGSTDGTVAWLDGRPNLRLHLEQQRSGGCRAYDLGFRLARAPYVMWLNDDSFPLPGAVENALALLMRQDMQDVGLVAFYHTHHEPQNELHGFDREGFRWGVLHVRGYPYANFGLLRRDLLERVGFLDTGYYFCAWDPDLALKVQLQAGLKVIGCPTACVFHEELVDERKAADAAQVRWQDNERLFAKWHLPPRGQYPDPRPQYLALLRSRGLLDDEPQPYGPPVSTRTGAVGCDAAAPA